MCNVVHVQGVDTYTCCSINGKNHVLILYISILRCNVYYVCKLLTFTGCVRHVT